MSIWNDAFETFLDVEYGWDTDAPFDDEPSLTSQQAMPAPKAIYVLLQFDDDFPKQPQGDNTNLESVQEVLKKNEKRLELIERQYEALVAHFGQEAVDAAKRALRARQKRSDQDSNKDDSQT